MDEVAALPAPVAFKVYGRALEWGYPMGVGYRYLSVPQSGLLVRRAAIGSEASETHLHAILEAARAEIADSAIAEQKW